MSDEFDWGKYDEPGTESGGGGRKKYDDVPDGDYDVLVEEAEATESKSGKPMLRFKMRIEGPKYINRVVFRNQVTEGNDGKPFWFVLKELGIFGIERWKDVPAMIGNAEGSRVAINISHKGEYQNIKFVELLAPTKKKAAPEQKAEVNDDDVPF